MPTYEYACSHCGHSWEEVQRITENPVDTCPSCKKKTARRQISAANFILKGGGWYSDLYSSKPAKKAENGAATADGKTESKVTSGEAGAKEAGAKKESTPAPAKDASKD